MWQYLFDDIKGKKKRRAGCRTHWLAEAIETGIDDLS